MVLIKRKEPSWDTGYRYGVRIHMYVIYNTARASRILLPTLYGYLLVRSPPYKPSEQLKLRNTEYP
jgi:hypothetical protein